MRALIRDPLLRRIITACIFAAAFIWVAVAFFDVDVQVMWRFFIGSLLLVAAMIGLALVFSLALTLIRRKRSAFLDDAHPRDGRRDKDDRDDE